MLNYSRFESQPSRQTVTLKELNELETLQFLKKVYAYPPTISIRTKTHTQGLLELATPVEKEQSYYISNFVKSVPSSTAGSKKTYKNKVFTSNVYKEKTKDIQKSIATIPVYAVLNGQDKMILANPDIPALQQVNSKQVKRTSTGSFGLSNHHPNPKLGLFFFNKKDALMYLEGILEADPVSADRDGLAVHCFSLDSAYSLTRQNHTNVDFHFVPDLEDFSTFMTKTKKNRNFIFNYSQRQVDFFVQQFRVVPKIAGTLLNIAIVHIVDTIAKPILGERLGEDYILENGVDHRLTPKVLNLVLNTVAANTILKPSVETDLLKGERRGSSAVYTGVPIYLIQYKNKATNDSGILSRHLYDTFFRKKVRRILLCIDDVVALCFFPVNLLVGRGKPALVEGDLHSIPKENNITNYVFFSSEQAISFLKENKDDIVHFSGSRGLPELKRLIRCGSIYVTNLEEFLHEWESSLLKNEESIKGPFSVRETIFVRSPRMLEDNTIPKKGQLYIDSLILKYKKFQSALRLFIRS